jgi:general secretion pathway protein M
MMAGGITLPEGRQGQLTALAITLAGAVLLWLAIAAPIIGWYQARAASLAQAQQIAARMTALGRQIPDLRRAVREAGLQNSSAQLLLPGNSDAVAGANLQSALQTLAATAGTSLDSSELLPAQPTGALRRIGMQVSLTADWPVLIALLQAIGTARPRMIVTTLSLNNTTIAGSGQAPSIAASFTVIGFRAGGA